MGDATEAGGEVSKKKKGLTKADFTRKRRS
jgi:hypothetical protein